MIPPSKFVQCFFETFDKSAARVFRRWLEAHPSTDKWIIAADFALRDKSRPGDCFAFSIIPYDTLPLDFSKEVQRRLPRDIKASKTLDANGASWLRSRRHFHILIPMNRNRQLYISNPGTKSIDVVRESLALTLDSIIQLERGDDQIRRFREAIQKAEANSFNVALFTDLTLLSLYLCIATLVVCRERKNRVVSWFCDRDSMTNYCNGIVWDCAKENFFGVAEQFGVDSSSLKLGVAAPDRSSGKEIMWYDEYIRAPDWLAGALAAWDREENLVPSESDKYVQLIQDVLADSDNTVILPIQLDRDGLRITRLEVSRKPAGENFTPGG